MLLSVAALLLCAASPPRPPEVAITIDDLPEHLGYPTGDTPQQVSDRMLAALKAAHIPAFGFVNAVKVHDQPETAQVLRDWRAAGFVLGNHGWSHRHLSEMSLGEFEQELVKGEPVLKRLGAGTDWHWFRYPFLDEGKDAAQRAAARQILARHGYRVAAVSMSFDDWKWTEPYARCASAHDDAAVAQLARLYLQSAGETLARSRASAHMLVGRDIPYVVLMHVSALSARMMPQVIKLYRNAGVRFVSLQEAERDPVYQAYTNLSLPAPPSPQELAARRGVKLPHGTDVDAELAAMCVAAH